MTDDWIYSDERLMHRSRCLYILLSKFGSALTENGEPLHSSQSMYECAHDWVSQGNKGSSGIVNYFSENYTNRVKS